MQQTIDLFYSGFQPFIREVLLGTVGLNAGTIQIADVRTGRNVPLGIESIPCGDRFKMVIPYAGNSITWDVIFDSMDPKSPPDFLFNEDFMNDPPPMEYIENSLPSLVNWDCSNDKALLQLINELLAMFKKYQVKLLLEEFQRFNFEYLSLTGEASIKEDDIEVLIGGGSSLKKSRSTSGGGVSFLIKLNVDFGLLPPTPEVRNYGDEQALLRVTFYSADLSKIHPELLVSPGVEHVLGKNNSLQLPQFTAHDCLMDYVPNVQALLLDRITVVTTAYEKRKEFIGAFMHKLNSVIEFDSLSLTRITFLMERQDFFFLLNVTLPPNFPREKPILVLQSIYHSNMGKPYEMRGDDYPYSPRWQPADMISRALAYIDGLVVMFQQNSIESADKLR